MMKSRKISSANAQHGASLIFALMVLVMLSLAAVGLIRSVNTGTLIAGNLSFKRDTTQSATAGAEQAIAWLQLNVSIPNGLDNDNVGAAYFASAKDDLDVTGTSTSASVPLQVVNWDGNCQGLPPSSYSACNVIPVVGNQVNGNKVQWVITRMCDFDGPMGPANPKGNNLCSKPAAQTLAITPEKGAIPVGTRLTITVPTPYYRVVTRVTGPRNTVSYIETVLHF